MRRRLVLYLYSGKNILGCFLALLGVVLHLIGLERFWWLVVIGLYLIGALLVPSPTRTPELHREFDAADVEKTLKQVLTRVMGRVPDDIFGKIQAIENAIQLILPRVGEFGPGSKDLFILQRTATDYLPDALESYLRLPRAYATVHPIREGKTARQLLADQLDLLLSQMNEIAIAVNKHDADKLLAHGRFLEERFGRKDLSLDT
jgi:hypothetical protein